MPGAHLESNRSGVIVSFPVALSVFSLINVSKTSLGDVENESAGVPHGRQHRAVTSLVMTPEHSQDVSVQQKRSSKGLLLLDHQKSSRNHQSGLPQAGATQTETSLLVNVWICLMILISQQEPWLKQKNCLHSVRLHYFSSLCSYITPVSKNIFSIRYARCNIKTVVCTTYPQVTAGHKRTRKIMSSYVNPHAILRWTWHHMVYIGGIVQSVSAQLWNIHSTICTLKIIYLTFSVWAMLLADSFKHLAVEIPDHGWSVYRQMRAANSLLMTTVIQKTLFWGKCPTACSSRSPSCSGPTRFCLFVCFIMETLQAEASLQGIQVNHKLLPKWMYRRKRAEIARKLIPQ